MKVEKTITMMAEYVPQLLNDWLTGSMPVDLSVLPGRWKGFRVIRVIIEAQTTENLTAKIRAFNAMSEAQAPYALTERINESWAER